MKEYIITVKDRSHKVVIKKIQTDTAIVEVNGEEYEVGIERKFSRHLEPLSVKPTRRTTTVEEKAEKISERPAGSVGKNEIVAPLPGMILKILVRNGQKLKSGETVIKMEAMKMENEIKTDQDGIVKQIYVKEGDTVLENSPLLRVENP
jgi:biotin carboxyl carrier protein